MVIDNVVVETDSTIFTDEALKNFVAERKESFMRENDETLKKISIRRLSDNRLAVRYSTTFETLESSFTEIDGIKITAHGFKFSEGEAKNYIAYVKEHAEKPNGEKLTEVIVTMCDDGKVDVHYKFEGEKFERIRRITGFAE